MELNKYIDHTALKADTTQAMIDQLLIEAKTYQFMSVCVNPTWVKHAADFLKGTDVKVCTVIGFPLGANTSSVKAFEAQQAIADGATEVDMVINIGALKSGMDDVVASDIQAVVSAAKEKALVKVIIETCLLTETEKIKVCKMAQEAGADFVKTSTGFSTAGATIEDVALMRKTVGQTMGVKASGGINNLAETRAMLAAGATRIGASKGVTIIKGLENTSADQY